MIVRLKFLIVVLVVGMAVPIHANAFGSDRSSRDDTWNHFVYLPLAIKAESQPLTTPTPTPVLTSTPTPVLTSTPTPVLTQPATGRVFYVSPTGNNAWPGSLERPFKTINKGVGVLQSGDTLYVRGGMYQETVSIENSGTEAAPIRILAYPGETPIVDGNDYTLPTNTWGVLFSIVGDYVQAAGFEVRNSNWMGVVLYGQHDSASRMNVHHIREQGMMASGDYGIIEDSQVWEAANRNVPGGPYQGGGWACALCAGRDAADGVTDGAILRRNVSHDNHGEGLSTFEATGSVLESNTVYDNMTNIYVSDAQNVLVQGNFAYYTAANSISGAHIGIMLGDETHVPPSHNITIVNNLAYGNRNNLFWWSGGFGEGMANVLVAYNTLVNAAGDRRDANLHIDSGPHQGVRVMNNIIEQDDAVPIASVPAGLSLSNNLWSKAPPRAASGTGDVIGDPLLAKGATVTADWFKPLASSPAMNCAAALAEVAVDYLGNPRGALPDIGAYEVEKDLAVTCSSSQNRRSTSLTRAIDLFVRIVTTLSGEK